MSTLTKTEEKSKLAPWKEELKSLQFTDPIVNIHQDSQGYMLEVEMPGVPKGGVEVCLEEGKLILTGHRKHSEEEGKTIYHESDDYDYRRIFDLDPTIDTSKVTARIDQGLLSIQLPKAESSKPRKIDVR